MKTYPFHRAIGSHTPAGKRASNRRSRGRHGVTLVESMVSFSLLTLIGGSFMNIFTNTISTAGRVTAINYTAWDAANAVDRINLEMRTARRFEFMDIGTDGPTAYQTPLTPGNDSNYYATLTSGATIVTGIHIVFPASLATVSLNIPSGAGYATTAMNGTNNLVDYRNDGVSMDVYRSDTQGHPAPISGTCLWIRGTMDGATIPTDSHADIANGIDGRPLIKDVATGSGSVQFVQGQSNEVQIKVVTGMYDRTHSQLTSDNTSGTSIALTAEHAYLRNHDPNGVTSGSAHGKTQYTGN